MDDPNPYESPKEDTTMSDAVQASKDRLATRDTVVLPFTVGMLLGGVVTGWIICVPIGHGTQLIALATSPFLAFLRWIVQLLLSVAFASLLALTVLVLHRRFVETMHFRLTPRFSPITMAAIGIVVVSVSAIASCLTLGSWLSKELGSHKGPDPLFPYFLFALSIITSLLIVRWTPPIADQHRG